MIDNNTILFTKDMSLLTKEDKMKEQEYILSFSQNIYCFDYHKVDCKLLFDFKDELTSMFPICRDIGVELRKSNKEGLGLFAKTFIPANTIITYYPHDLAVINDDPKFISPEFLEYMYAFDVNSYRLGVGENFWISSNPNIVRSNYLGHMINDSNIINYSLGDTFETIKKKVNIYNKLSCITNNSVLTSIGMFAVVFSIKPIYSNEEIFSAYGSDYWIGRINRLKNTNFKDLPFDDSTYELINQSLCFHTCICNDNDKRKYVVQKYNDLEKNFKD